MKNSKFIIIILLSVILIAQEISTRIFPADSFYTFTFIVLSLVILTSGLGALQLRLLPYRYKAPGLNLYLSRLSRKL